MARLDTPLAHAVNYVNDCDAQQQQLGITRKSFENSEQFAFMSHLNVKSNYGSNKPS